MVRVVGVVVAVFAAAVYLIQVITGRPPIGALTIALFVIPALIATVALAPSSWAWPEMTLVTLGWTLAQVTLTGLITALSPHGLNASSVAAVQLVAVAVTTAGWLWRSRPPRWPTLSIRLHPGSILIVAIGVALGATGIAVASQAAQEQDYETFVQFWSVPTTSGEGQLVGIRNATSLRLDCAVTLDRPSQPAYNWPVQGLNSGQAWQSQLPRSTVPTTGPWQLTLHCAGPDGSLIDRRLIIDPPTQRGD
jgi:hypothetical protein